MALQRRILNRDETHRFLDVCFEHTPANARRMYAEEGITGNELVVRGGHGGPPRVETPLWIMCFCLVSTPATDVATMFPALDINATDSEGNNVLLGGYLSETKLAYLLKLGINVHHRNVRGLNALTRFWTNREFATGDDYWRPHQISVAYQLIDLGVALEKAAPQFLLDYAARSALRRAACKRTCIALLGSVKPRDVARMLARAVWETRLNRERWEPSEPNELK